MLKTHDSVDSASPGNLSPPEGACVYLSLRRVTIAGVCDAKSLPSSDADVPEVESNLLLAAHASRSRIACVILLKYTRAQSARNVQIGHFALTDYRDPLGSRILRRKHGSA